MARSVLGVVLGSMSSFRAFWACAGVTAPVNVSRQEYSVTKTRSVRIASPTSFESDSPAI